jgi:Trk-type K+ transport system membrane component
MTVVTRKYTPPRRAKGQSTLLQALLALFALITQLPITHAPNSLLRHRDGETLLAECWPHAVGIISKPLTQKY